jgi:hypothetical protein
LGLGWKKQLFTLPSRRYDFTENERNSGSLFRFNFIFIYNLKENLYKKQWLQCLPTSTILNVKPQKMQEKYQV